jgi:hypothetical protein
MNQESALAADRNRLTTNVKFPRQKIFFAMQQRRGPNDLHRRPRM